MPNVNKHWCFTWNNPTIALSDLKALIESKGWKLIYGIYQEEIGSALNYHIQGYIELDKHATVRELRAINGAIHWEKRKGSREQARDYCRKLETRKPNTTPLEDGIWLANINGLGPGLRRMVESAQDGERLGDIVDADPETFVRYRGGIEQLVARAQRKRHRAELRDVKIVWIIGASGSGKSMAVYNHIKNREFYRKRNHKWWSGYEGEPIVWWDDFSPRDVDFTDLLAYLDRYGVEGETKGGHVQLIYTEIYITSVESPIGGDFGYPDPRGELSRRLNGKIVVKQQGQDIIL